MEYQSTFRKDKETFDFILLHLLAHRQTDGQTQKGQDLNILSGCNNAYYRVLFLLCPRPPRRGY